MTLDELKKAVRDLGMSISYNVDTQEYRVNFKGGTAATAYFTTDRQDALETAKKMARYMESKMTEKVLVQHTLAVKLKRLTIKQIAIVLEAIERVECWDSERASIQTAKDGSWEELEGCPMPSVQLVAEIRRLEDYHMKIKRG